MLVRRFIVAFTSLLVDLCLLLSAFSPLFLIGRVRAEDNTVQQWLLGIGIGFTLLLVIPIVGALNRAAEDFRVDTVESLSGEVAAYVATYILPLLMASDKKPNDFAAYGLLLAFIGIIFIRGHLLHYNPWIFMFGRSVYSIRVGANTYYLIAKNEPKPGTDVVARLFAKRFMLT
jgi:hypothetical protein